MRAVYAMITSSVDIPLWSSKCGSVLLFMLFLMAASFKRQICMAFGTCEELLLSIDLLL